MIDTFNSNSLKILDKSLDEFIDKFVFHLSIYKKDERTLLGSKYHALICQYLRGYDISKMKKELASSDVLDSFLKTINKNNFIKTEYSFLTKDELFGKPYYLSGRYDAIYKKEDEYIIYDWKTLNIPKNIEEDLQTVVYLHTASKIFNTKNIKMRYISIEKKEYRDVQYNKEDIYKKRIDKIIEKYYGS